MGKAGALRNIGCLFYTSQNLSEIMRIIITNGIIIYALTRVCLLYTSRCV